MSAPRPAMVRHALRGAVAGLLALPLASAPPSRPRRHGPAVGPALFAAGTVSTPDDELNAAFTPDGRTVYFTRKAGGGRLGVILSSRAAAGGGWSAPRVERFSGQWADYDPIVSPDGSRLFFASNRPPAGAARKPDLDIWVVERAPGPGAGWGTPRHLGAPVDSEHDELYPSVAADGTLYFSSCGRADSRGRCDLYRAPLVDGAYGPAENLGDSVNTGASETDAFVAPDQRYLVFAAYGRADGVGDGDLYVSTRRGARWSAPRPLGAGVNSAAREYAPIVSPDGAYLYFTSERGFPDTPRQRPLTTTELRDSLRSIRNGLGNVYRIPVAALGVEAAASGPDDRR